MSRHVGLILNGPDHGACYVNQYEESACGKHSHEQRKQTAWNRASVINLGQKETDRPQLTKNCPDGQTTGDRERPNVTLQLGLVPGLRIRDLDGRARGEIDEGGDDDQDPKEELDRSVAGGCQVDRLIRDDALRRQDRTQEGPDDREGGGPTLSGVPVEGAHPSPEFLPCEPMRGQHAQQHEPSPQDQCRNRKQRCRVHLPLSGAGDVALRTELDAIGMDYAGNRLHCSAESQVAWTHLLALQSSRRLRAIPTLTTALTVS